jgi:hypothetical protein
MQTEIEIWRSVVGYEEYYEISNLGNVHSKGKKYIDSLGRHQNRKPRNVKVRSGANGYFCVDLNANGVNVQETIHVLLATAFIPNPENKPTVNNKNGIKSDISIDNLEWATYSENNQHAIDTGLRQSPWTGKLGVEHPLSKMVTQYDKANKKINKFTGCHEAERITGISFKHISACCLGNRKTAGGYIWKYNVQETVTN